MSEKIFDVFIPKETVTEIKQGGKKVTSDKKVFPGYILVEMQLDDDSWYVVRNTPGVTGFVGSQGKPVALSRDEVKRIKGTTGVQGVKPKSFTEFHEGMAVKVTSGPLAEFDGTDRRGQRRPGQDQGHGLDLRARDPGRARVRPGREAVDSASRGPAGGSDASPGFSGRRVDRAGMDIQSRRLIERGRRYSEDVERMAKKVVGFIKLQIPAGQANPAPPVGPCARTAPGQHHAVLPGVQRPDAGQDGHHHPGRDHGLRGPLVHLHHEDPAGAVLLKQAAASTRARARRTASRSPRSRATRSARSPRPSSSTSTRTTSRPP